MYIENLNITAFGRLNDFELDLTPGINIIEGANESGKSTITAFIKFMFYGLTPKERTVYIGWNSSIAAGTLTFKSGEKRYRIERALKCISTGSKQTFKEAVQLVDLSNNMPCHKGESPGLLFFGVDADMFAATAFVSQLGGTTVKGAKVSDGIENLLFSADESINTQRALDKIDAARVQLLHKNAKGGRIYELSNEIAELEARLDESLKMSAEIRAKEAKLADMRAKEASDRQKADILTEKLEIFEAQTVAKLFDRMHLLEAKTAELKSQIESSGTNSADTINALRTAYTKIDQLKQQLNSMQAPEKTYSDHAMDKKLEEFSSHGGRSGLEDEKSDLRSAVKSHFGAGVVLTVFAFCAFAVAALTNILKLDQMFMIGGILIGILMAAFAVILFRSANKSKTELRELDEAFDIELMESELNHRNAENDAARTAAVIKQSVQNQLDEALSAVKRDFGIEPDILPEKLKELDAQSREAAEQCAEYDKNCALLTQMRGQLERYDETDIRSKVGKNSDGVDAANLNAVKREAEFLTNSAKSLERFSIQLERELAQTSNIENPSKLEDRLNALKLERSKLEKQLAGLKLADEKLREASANLRSSVAPRLAENAGKLLGVITEQKYSEVGVGNELDLTCRTECGQKNIDLLSAGTQDAAYLALRISLCGLIYRKDAPPMIFDESFGRIDNERCKAMLKLVAGCEQSLILTACGREKELAGVHNYLKI